MEEVKFSSEKLLDALSHVPYHYLPKQVREAMQDLRASLRRNQITAEKAKSLVASIDQNTERIPHQIKDYVDDLNSSLALAS